MKQNIGGIDRFVRAVLGIAIVVAGVYYKSWWGALGAPLLLTATLNWCPAYVPFGLSTRGKDRA